MAQGGRVSAYAHLEAEHAPRKVVDHSARWETFAPIASVNGQLEERLVAFCEAKRITVEALAALGTRIVTRRNGQVDLAFAGTNDTGAVTAIKYRPLGGGSHDCTAEQPSTWLRPIVVGRPGSLDWLVAEGETDGARLYGLVGDRAAILVLPAGARALRREWLDLIPRGATVALCHDADEHGDAGADKATRMIGGRTIRLRPPVEGADWCDWAGDRDDLLELIGDAKASVTSEPPAIVAAHEFAAVDEPGAEALLGEGDDDAVLPMGGDSMIYGDGGAGKTTWAIDLAVHLAAGVDFLGIRVGQPVNVLLVENEGPRALYRRKLDRKLTAWAGPNVEGRLLVWAAPWGKAGFGTSEQREQLAAAIEQHAIDISSPAP